MGLSLINILLNVSGVDWLTSQMQKGYFNAYFCSSPLNSSSFLYRIKLTYNLIDTFFFFQLIEENTKKEVEESVIKALSDVEPGLQELTTEVYSLCLKTQVKK